MLASNAIKEVNFTFDTMSLQGLVCGNDQQKDNVVLCLHGWLDNAASFLPLLPYFQQNMPEKQFIALDWAGHGNSSHKSLDAHYHFIDWVYDLLQLFEHKQWQNVDIVAHSMGGMVASAFAAAFPERVRSLTLIDSIGFISAKAEQTTKQLRDGMLSRFKNNTRQLNTQQKKLHPNPESAIKARIAVSDLKYQQAKILVERGLLKESQGFSWRTDSRLRNTSPYRLTLKQAQQFIRDIKCPVQLIYGSKGLDLVNSGIEIFGPLFERFSSIEVAGGHHVHMEQPEKIAELIQYFLDE